MTSTDPDALPEPIVIPVRLDQTNDLLSREWLLANALGAYASATVLGTNTRRYHGLLVAATRPPVGRVVALSCLLDRLVLTNGHDEKAFDLAAPEFDGTFSPDGRGNLTEFRNAAAATFAYRCDGTRLVKEVLLADDANAVGVRYSLNGAGRGSIRIRPFVALRDYHNLRRAAGSLLAAEDIPGGVRVTDQPAALTISIRLSPGGRFRREEQWWNRFRYRADLARGQDGYEDLYSPGWLEVPLGAGESAQLTAWMDGAGKLDFNAALTARRRRQVELAAAVGSPDPTTRRLAVATDAFLARRPARNGKARGSQADSSALEASSGATLLAGFHWFADWGRDAMIALPGLLLETGRHQAALEVLRTFAQAADSGMIPNCFDEYGGPPNFSSVDASLWFVLAAEEYLRASGDRAGFRGELFPVIEQILRAYLDGTRYGIRCDRDGLLSAGDASTQLTWMDVKLAGAPVTPRHGKPVEVNALWHEALAIAAEHAGDRAAARGYADAAAKAAAAFGPTFWNERAGCLYDCVRNGFPDEAIRPNQILAVALQRCPLERARQRSVVEVVRRDLLTPLGLRTLSPRDPRYRGRCGQSLESRDRAYHQGTAWAWLMGPFIRAYLKVHDFSPAARRQGRQWLAAFDDHLPRAGVGFISEIFDGDPPHEPGGCIAQAWSVAEILRAKRLLERPGP